MKLTFHQRKVLLQLQANPYPSADMLRRKRAMAPVLKLVELGYLEPETDEEDPCCWFLTEKGKAALDR
jgi:DNA-binding MarR family transcriptional regulator